MLRFEYVHMCGSLNNSLRDLFTNFFCMYIKSFTKKGKLSPGREVLLVIVARRQETFLATRGVVIVAAELIQHGAVLLSFAHDFDVVLAVHPRHDFQFFFHANDRRRAVFEPQINCSEIAVSLSQLSRALAVLFVHDCELLFRVLFRLFKVATGAPR